MTDDAIRRARVARGAGRLLRVVTLSVGVAALVGCGSFWPWSGPSKPKPAELPAVNGSARLATAWRVPVGKTGLGFLPVVAAGSVFASSRDGAIVRVDAGTGRVLWRVNVGKPLVGGVGSDGETTVVAAADGALVAFDAEGKQRWTVPLGAEAVSVPVVAEGLVLVRGAVPGPRNCTVVVRSAVKKA